MTSHSVDRTFEPALAAVDAALRDISALSAEIRERRISTARRVLASAHVRAALSRKQRGQE
ncbi:hypothetical protein [Salinarimonas sp.]|uniref:hypothetical protein n=1 Tax=Salinarimonas sp. TaxID=2766526 RepID=UPI0032D9A419